MSADTNDTNDPGRAGQDELDRHRRRVLWALPTGLYLIGSRHGEDVNLMTANLVVQVCMEPKLVGVALEHDVGHGGPRHRRWRFHGVAARPQRSRRGPALRETRHERRARP